MAKAEKQETVVSVTLTLSGDEAQALTDFLFGDPWPVSPAGKWLNDIHDSLNAAGFYNAADWEKPNNG